MNHPSLEEEKKLKRKGFRRIAGLDEVGRGPLAAPVFAAAVVVRPDKMQDLLLKVKDSKKLSAKKREELYTLLTNNPNIDWGIGQVSEKVIDKINILEATKVAMIKALKNLEKKSGKVDFLVLDGRIKLNLNLPQKAVIKGDDKIFSVAAASIIAKVTRDRLMDKLHKKYPRYGFNKHKGYPTKYHRKMLAKYGPCKIHRQSFGPVKRSL